ncbi:alpha/beta hydrolase [Plesiomonas sp.]|uniref:alpha/beta hydrolase n=1 Tax=Plesiomonas sp. TaxID=2486279 RepID=UPI003F351C0D
MFWGGAISSNENRSNNMLSRYFNHKLFGKEKERRDILLYTQDQLNYAVKNEQSEKVVVVGEAGRLAGYYHKGTQLDESKNKINKVVLFLHGSGSPVEQQSIAVNQQYQSHGVDVLAVNMRGYGKSEGRPSEEGFYQDARTMFHYLVNEKGITPDNIIIHGYSMGAPIAADLARYAERNGMVVSGLLLDRPMPSMTKAITAHGVVNPAGSVGALLRSVNGQFSVEKNIKGLTNNVPIMLLTDCGGLGVEGEKLRSKLVASGHHVMGENTRYTHEQSDRLMYQYTSNIVSSFSG